MTLLYLLTFKSSLNLPLESYALSFHPIICLPKITIELSFRGYRNDHLDYLDWRKGFREHWKKKKQIERINRLAEYTYRLKWIYFYYSSRLRTAYLVHFSKYVCYEIPTFMWRKYRFWLGCNFLLYFMKINISWNFNNQMIFTEAVT